MSAYNWINRYTIEEMERIMDNMFDFVSGELENEYNYGITDKNELIQKFIDMGFKEDDIREWYNWIEE